MKTYFDVPQGSAEWFRLRMGKPTASCFHKILTPKTRKLSEQWKRYACELIGERLTNMPTESLEGQEWMERGKELEPAAVQQLEFVQDIKTVAISFITNDDGSVGCSPDRVVMTEARIDKVVEVKCPSLPVHLQRMLFGQEDAYVCQVQGQIMLAEVDEAIYYSYHPMGPATLIRTYRDDAFIADLDSAVREFNDRLHELHLRAMSLGDWQSFKEALAPVDVEMSDEIE